MIELNIIDKPRPSLRRIIETGDMPSLMTYYTQFGLGEPADGGFPYIVNACMHNQLHVAIFLILIAGCEPSDYNEDTAR